MNKTNIIEQITKMADIPEEKAEKAFNVILRIFSSEFDIEIPDFDIDNNKEKPKRHVKPYVQRDSPEPLMVSEPSFEYQLTASYAFPSQKQPVSKAILIDELNEKKESFLIINELLEITGLPAKTIADKIYEMTPKTLHSYKQKGRFLPTKNVELSIKIRELYKKGLDIFAGQGRFNQWLMRNSYGLGQTKPIDFMNSATGIDLIYEELLRIEFGATA